MRIVKRVFVGLFGFLAVVVLAAVLIPYIFKDKIKAKVDEELAKTVNADVVFDVNNFSLSVFRHFPNVAIEIKSLGVFNRAPFAGEHLFVVDRIDVELNLKYIIFGDQLRVKGITLIRPQINVKVLADGRANYDITYPSTDTAKSSTPQKFSFGIDNWAIENGEVRYDDASLKFNLALKGLNHTGAGNFNEREFDLTTKTESDSVTMAYSGVQYLTNKHVILNAVIGISENYTRYAFKENLVKVNDFAAGAEGWFKMNEKDYGMDIAFKSPENSFKSLLSLVPGMYTKDFAQIETKGDLSFSGTVKGTYSDTQMPSFSLALQVKDAMFKYPSLPTAVSHVQLDLAVDNPTGVVANTSVNLKNLHLELGNNPVDARATIANLKDYRTDAKIKAVLNLAELNKMFPMEGLEMKGTFQVDASAQGAFDNVQKVMPTLNATASLANGYVKSSKFPLPLENLKFTSTLKNTSGNMSETLLRVKDFSMLLDGEKVEANLVLQNLIDYTWDLQAAGAVDLEKMTKIFPLAGMTLAGKVQADISTKGKYSDVTAKRYNLLPTSGTAAAKDFKYTSTSLPYAIGISESHATFNPQKIEVTNTSGTIGRSDFNVQGAVTNYIGYLFGKETIAGNLNFNATLLDLNEFMTPGGTASDTAKLTLISVPDNLDFTLHADVKTVKMMEYVMTNAIGDVAVAKSVADLRNVRFNLLGGAFAVNGTYNTRDLQHPRFDFGLKIDNLSIQQAENSFSIVKKYAPIAGMATGKFGTDFKISGELNQNMKPKLNTVNGNGLINIAQAAIAESPVIKGITSITKLQNTDKVTLKDVVMSASIADGKLSVKPFNVKFGDYFATVNGATSLTGGIDYALKMNVPAGKMGAQLQALVNQNGGATAASSEIPLNIKVGGTFTNPKATLISDEQKQQVKQAVTEAVTDKAKEAVQQAVQGTQVQDAVNTLLGVKKDSAAAKADSAKTKTVQDVLQNKLQNLLKKKKN